MRVLITGATGFLGKYVVDEFARNGCEVIAFGRDKGIGESLKNCIFFQGDFTDFEDILRATKGIDVVVHAGALSSVWGRWSDFERANIFGTENVARACLNSRVGRLVFVSSPSVYAAPRDRFAIKEAEVDRENELNYYIKSKISAEKIVGRFGESGLETVIVRPRGLFGIGDTSIIPRLINANARGGIPLIGGGKNIVDVTYVPNAARALYLAAMSADVSGEIFNITNAEPMEFGAILGQVFTKIGVEPRYRPMSFRKAYMIAGVLECVYKTFRLSGEPPLTRYTACTLGTSQTLDISNAVEKLRYTPRYSIAEGIAVYADWWNENH
jgi:nucleoside-diphosphate-sugar epimerase